MIKRLSAIKRFGATFSDEESEGDDSNLEEPASAEESEEEEEEAADARRFGEFGEPVTPESDSEPDEEEAAGQKGVLTCELCPDKVLFSEEQAEVHLRSKVHLRAVKRLERSQRTPEEIARLKAKSAKKKARHQANLKAKRDAKKSPNAAPKEAKNDGAQKPPKKPQTKEADPKPKRDFSEVQCNTCQLLGHYANKCPSKPAKDAGKKSKEAGNNEKPDGKASKEGAKKAKGEGNQASRTHDRSSTTSSYGGGRGACFDWQKGQCMRGKACRFSHDGEGGGASSNKLSEAAAGSSEVARPNKKRKLKTPKS